MDVDECKASANGPCHATAKCRNVPGSYKCLCLNRQVGDPYGSEGCRPKAECAADGDCPPASMCDGGKCVDPCEDFCGPGAYCRVRAHRPVCTCPPGTAGDPRYSNFF